MVLVVSFGYIHIVSSAPNPNIILETDVGAMGGVNGAVDCGLAGDTTAQQTFFLFSNDWNHHARWR